MANVLADGTSLQSWKPAFQRNLHRALVSELVSDTYTGPERIIHNPYQSVPAGSDGTAATAYTITDYVLADDTLTVNRRATVAEHIDNIEQLQTRYDLAMARAQEHAYVVKDKIDQYMLNLPVVATGVVKLDDSNLNPTPGTSGNPFQITAVNSNTIPNLINQYLSIANARTENGVFWVVSPLDINAITAYMQSHGFNVADSAIKNGFVGSIGNLDIIMSNNLTNVVNLTIAVNPGNGETITINGVVFTFVTTIGTAAGNVLIGASAAATQTNLLALLTAPGTTTANGVALATDDSAEFSRQGIVLGAFASNVASLSAYSTLTLKSSTNAVFGNVGRHTIAGVKGAMQLALPTDGFEFEKKAVSGKHGREMVTSQIYAGTIWKKMQPQLLDVFIRS